jgi:hypothetical protein
LTPALYSGQDVLESVDEEGFVLALVVGRDHVELGFARVPAAADVRQVIDRGGAGAMPKSWISPFGPTVMAA